MPTECIRVSIHSEALKFGQTPDPLKPDLKDLVVDNSVLADAQKEGITSIGYNLSYAEDRALFAVQKLLDRTDFKGNSRPVKSTMPDTYYYYDELPVLEIKSTEYLDAYGVRKLKTQRHKNEYSPEARRDALDVLRSLDEQKYLLAYDKSRGQDTRKMHRVEAVAPLIKLEWMKGNRMIRIVPNPVLVDHIDSYYVLKPADIFTLVDGRSPTRLRFLEFLLYQAEMKRRKEVRDEESSDYEVRLQPGVIAHRLRLEGLISANQRSRLRGTINDLYAFGKEIGFLDSYSVDQPGSKARFVDVLGLNKTKFEEIRGKLGLVPMVGKSTIISSGV
ncbi:MAG: hypothetical protein NTU47_04350 [Ignavibacteriales bacterium]|nr:hypothetical protein [Ignavibacteriales bacterium]